ncbi:hypothetical protein VNO78_25612 [Psophocarpus tetragonolobus]|uniref:Uncharacterized protein n=1 Tax=Psophocarpus tetragonolobus TaxID=3891 RepID=A0AAN9S684_PSOTE
MPLMTKPPPPLALHVALRQPINVWEMMDGVRYRCRSLLSVMIDGVGFEPKGLVDSKCEKFDVLSHVPFSKGQTT